jgi:peptidoglycan-associated lipoprotein
VAAWAAMAAAAVACDGPKYPTCENDQQCNTDGHAGVCVNAKCVECRDDRGCGAGRTCQANACADIPGYCDASHACSDGQTCGVDSRCVRPKKVEPQSFVECDETRLCERGAHCENGHCVQPPQGGPGCTDFPAPHFDYESPELRADSRATLERLASCVLKGTLKGGEVLLTGHCDSRGEQEFNMSLGDNRAQAVRLFLVGLGVPADKLRTSSRGELDAVGVDEAGWANDRRVDIEVR